MFDGFETKRARVASHFDWVLIRLAFGVRIARVLVDMTYFVHNNPRAIEIQVGARRRGGARA